MYARYECAPNDEILMLIYTSNPRIVCKVVLLLRKKFNSYFYIISVRNIYFHSVDEFYPAFNETAIYRITCQTDPDYQIIVQRLKRISGTDRDKSI